MRIGGLPVRAKSARLALATVLAEGFLGRLTFGMVSFAMPLYAHKIGLPLSLIGILVSIRTLCVLPLAGSRMAGRPHRRPQGVPARHLRQDAFGGHAAVRGRLRRADGCAVIAGSERAGRDVASLGVIARDAASRVGTAYGSYASAKHVGGVAGAGLAGLIIAAPAEPTSSSS